MIRQMAAGYPAAETFVDAYLASLASEADTDSEDHVHHRAHQSETTVIDARDGETAEDSEDGTYRGEVAGTTGDREQPEGTPGGISPGEDRITITTIHRSKGDEFKGVILFHVAEDILPHRRMTGSDEDIEEERRVFYVALTRAEERLCITTQRKRPSRFLAEMKPARGIHRFLP